MNERILELETYASLAEHVKAEADRLVAVAAEQIARLEDARGTAQAMAIEHLVERELLDLQQQLSRAQWRLVHRRDDRFAACQRLLSESVAPAQQQAQLAAA